MQPASKPQELRQRIARIRMPKGDLATAATLDPMTISRVLGDRTDPLVSTLTKIEQALVEEEIALRDHLLTLHPLPHPLASGESHHDA